jgi:hypothetical protein
MIALSTSCTRENRQETGPSSNLNSAGVAVTEGQSDVADTNVVPQARPVIELLRSVKNGDLNELKSVFAEAVEKNFDGIGWDEIMTTYRELFAKEFGDYEMVDFTFEFSGSEDEGAVSIVHKGKELPAMRVICENSNWKLNER